MSLATTARAKAILVFGEGDTAIAVTTDLIVTALSNPTRQRVRFSGPVTFHPKLKRHVRQVLLPFIDRICQGLRIKRRCFEISSVNLGAASSLDRGIQISGFSADLPLFSALLAACCQLDLPPDMVSTGHIASREGEIRIVRQLAQKLHAAAINRSLTRFIHPDLAADDSVANLAPNERAELAAVTRGNRGRLSLVPVRHVGELIKAVFGEQGVLLGSLKAGYFGRSIEAGVHSSVLDEALAHLRCNLPARFCRCLETALLQGDSVGTKSLLEAYADFHLRRRRYPKDFGAELSQILASIPPTTLRLKIQFPLLAEKQRLRLQILSGDADRDDFELLAQAVSGSIPASLQPPPLPAPSETTEPGTQQPLDASAVVSLDYLLAELDEANLVQKIDRVIDEARASFVMDSVVVPGNEEFLAAVTTFYLHVFRAFVAPKSPLDRKAAQAQALDWVIRTYAQKGGYAQALAEGCTGVQAGMRGVLDRMVKQLKIEKRQAHIHYHIRKAIDPTNWEERAHFLQALMTRFPDAVPSELRDAPPEQFVKDNDEIVAALVEGLVVFNRIAQTH